jgi:hypothetical protein
VSEETYLRTWLQDLQNELGKLKSAIYGDKDAPPDRKGGLYGELSRMRDEFRSDWESHRTVLAEVERRLTALEEKFDILDRRIRPRWWDYVILIGGAGVWLAVVLQILQIVGVL